MLLAMNITILEVVPVHVKIITTAIVCVLTCVLPMAIIYVMIKMGYVKDMDISNRRERTRPLIFAMVCYILATIYIAWVHAPLWLTMYFVSGLAVAIVACLISLKWKISVHGAGIGTAIGFLTQIATHGESSHSITWWIIGAIIIAGLLGTARVILHRHTPAQVVAGTVLGAVATYFIMCI